MENPEHELRPGMYGTVKLQVPATRLRSVRDALAVEWRDRTTVDLAAANLAAQAEPFTLGGLEPIMQMAGRYSLLGAGMVLAVPESAVIDTGSRKVVYRADTSGVYDGIQVRLGPRLAGPEGVAFYPVLHGLQAGDQVVTNGSFLIDAETRLNPAAGSIYYGGSGGPKGGSVVAARPTTPADVDAEVKAARAKLRPADRRLVAAQEFCPILKANRLGSMGTPVKVMLKGQPVFLCCKGCADKARANPERTLADVEKAKAASKTAPGRWNAATGIKAVPAPAASPAPPALSEEEAEIQEALAKLGPEDRRLAEIQKFCAVQERSRLGSMGTPVKVVLQGRAVFLCCAGCEHKAKADPDKTLGKVDQLKARTKAGTPAQGP